MPRCPARTEDSCGVRCLLLPLSQSGFQYIVRLQNLTLLKICGTHATEVEMSLITRLHKLESLAVSSREFIDKVMVNLRWLNELWCLSLHGQSITDESSTTHRTHELAGSSRHHKDED